jgi:hypothetical protein
MTEPKYLPTFAGWLVSLGEDVLSLANLLESSEVRSPWRRVSAEALESLLRASALIPDGLESLGYLEQAFIFRLLARRSLDGGGEDVAPGPSEAEGDGLDGAPEALEGLEAPEVFDAPEITPDWAAHEEPEAVLDEAAGREAPEGAVEGFGAGAPEAPSDGLAAGEAEATGSTQEDTVPGRIERLAADAPLVEEFIGEDLPALLDMAFVETRRGRRAQQLLEDAEARHDVLREARAWVEGYRAPELSESVEELVKIRSFFRTRLLRAS